MTNYSGPHPPSARQMVASVQLIEALGGVWNVSQLPDAKGITATVEPGK